LLGKVAFQLCGNFLESVVSPRHQDDFAAFLRKANRDLGANALTGPSDEATLPFIPKSIITALKFQLLGNPWLRFARARAWTGEPSILMTGHHSFPGARMRDIHNHIALRPSLRRGAASQ
jgi:hypothetical protein